MSDVLLQIDVTDRATPALDRLTTGLSAEGRTSLHGTIARMAAALTRTHLRVLGQTRHATAARLGATPTGFLQRAPERVSEQADSTAATVSIAQPGIARAFRDITIRPGGGKKHLTIPIHRLAYGSRVRDLERELGRRIFRPRGTDILAAKPFRNSKDFQPLYALVKSVTQRQDRTLLPSDEDYSRAAVEATRRHVASLLGERSDEGQ